MTTDDFLWWRDGVIYQIYPRSFADSNGDGIGDLPGITAHLDYLNDGTPNSLGVDAIWLSPIYPSPMHDFGYDVSNYHNVHPDFGTLDDFDRLVEEAHSRGIRVVMDWVMNHTSHRHPWFSESRSSRDNPKRDWYIWRDPGPKGQKPNNWRAVFGGSAWTWDENTRQYYLHLFLPEQPDLNWRNDKVVAALFDEARFWLDRGVDGFRLDVADSYYKDEGLRDNPPRFPLAGAWRDIRPYGWQDHLHDRNQPETHKMLRDFRKLLDEYPNRMAVGEVEPAHAEEYYGNGRDELHLAFNFDFLRCSWSARAFHTSVANWEKSLPRGAWPCYVLSNHDVKRHCSRYAAGRWTNARAKVAAALLLTLRGTPFLYYGEEIGMRQVSIPRSEIMDPPGKRYWPLYKGRDGCRTPMQWNDGPNAGFTSGEPWLRIGPEYGRVNVEVESTESSSVLDFYRQLIWLRKACPALVQGRYQPLLRRPVGQLAYLRSTVDQAMLVCLNFTSRPAELELNPADLPVAEWRIKLSSVHRDEEIVRGSKVNLGPFEACVLEGTA